jgi:hypothetical protein
MQEMQVSGGCGEVAAIPDAAGKESVSETKSARTPEPYAGGAGNGAHILQNQTADNGSGPAGGAHVADQTSLAELLERDASIKREYDESVRRIINKRFRTNRENDERLRRVDEMLPAISRRYGTPDGDLDALAEAVADAEGADRAAAEREKRGRAALYAKWDREIPEAAARFPGFDMRREMADPRFARLAVTAGVIEAYEAVHRKELDEILVERAKKEAAAEVAGSVAANFTRPSEGGLARAAAPLVRIDPRSLTSEERREIRRRLKRGEKISF